jgi:sulfur carrier protein ThiS
MKISTCCARPALLNVPAAVPGNRTPAAGLARVKSALTLAVLAAALGFLPAGAAAAEDFEAVVKEAAERTGLSRDQVRQVLEYVPELVGYALAQGNEVVLDGFGTFFVCDAADGDKTVCFAPESERRSSGAQTRTKGELAAQIETRTGLTRSVTGKLLGHHLRYHLRLH